MRVVPRPWFRPYHDRVVTCVWYLRGGRSVVTFPPGCVVTTPGPITLSGRNITIEGLHAEASR